MVRVVYVKKGNKNIGKSVGRSNYQKGIIYIRRELPIKARKMTIAHEKGHFRLSKFGINPIGTKIIHKELRKSNPYQFYLKRNYPKSRIPEEVFVELYAAVKTGMSSRRQVMKWAKKYPHFRRKLRRYL